MKVLTVYLWLYMDPCQWRSLDQSNLSFPYNRSPPEGSNIKHLSKGILTNSNMTCLFAHISMSLDACRCLFSHISMSLDACRCLFAQSFQCRWTHAVVCLHSHFNVPGCMPLSVCTVISMSLDACRCLFAQSFQCRWRHAFVKHYIH